MQDNRRIYQSEGIGRRAIDSTIGRRSRWRNPQLVQMHREGYCLCDKGHDYRAPPRDVGGWFEDIS